MLLSSISIQRNKLLKEDSVIIIVETDTNFPHGFHPQNDTVYGVTGEVTIDVLHNDVLRADSAQVGVVIYGAGLGFPPHAGTATVVSGNRIRYIPGGGFNGHDSIFYKVFSLADPAKSGIAKVVIAPSPLCQFQLMNDNFVFETDTLTTDTVWLNVFQNDQLCFTPVSSYQFEVLDDGRVGSAFYDIAGGLGYRLPDDVPQFRDSVIYRMCYRQRCETAKACMMEYSVGARTSVFFQPQFVHSLMADEVLHEPFAIKSYRAGLGFGLLYHFH